MIAIMCFDLVNAELRNALLRSYLDALNIKYPLHSQLVMVHFILKSVDHFSVDNFFFWSKTIIKVKNIWKTKANLIYK